jgi:aryl-alcohol dehydrogenase-like predicted oxidoreductase
MRLSTEPGRDEVRAAATIEAAIDAGVRAFDTARAYGLDADDAGHNERLVARVLEARVATGLRKITKCGMRRSGNDWTPDGRARAILADARASREAFGGRPADLLLLHAPDPRVPLATSARALLRALHEGLARSVGVSNVSRRQLEEVAAVVPVSAVEVALGAYDDLAVRSGVAAWCCERRIELLAYAPFGGPDRAARLARDPLLAGIAARKGALPLANGADVLLAYLLAVRPEIVPVVGARRPETAARLANVERIELDEDDLANLDARFPALGALRRPLPRPARLAGEVILLMGIPGAGKSRAAEAFVARGYERLNRDTAGGSLRAIAGRLDEKLAHGSRRVVLDNTYVSRASRSDVVRIARARGTTLRCVFFDTPLHEAQINAVTRMIERFGRLLSPEEIAGLARENAAALAPNAVFRMARALEPPSADEGFDTIEVVPFERETSASATRPGAVFALDALSAAARTFEADDGAVRALASVAPGVPCLVYAWRPGLDGTGLDRARSFAEALAHAVARHVEVAICTHAPGPPVCWCRPPLPGLWVAFAQRHGTLARTSTLFGASATDRAMARALQLTFRNPSRDR